MKKLHTFSKCCPFELLGCSKADQEICLDQSRALDIQHFLKVFKVGNRIGCDSDFFPANYFFLLHSPRTFQIPMCHRSKVYSAGIHCEQGMYSHCPCGAPGLLAETDNEPVIMQIMSSLHI